MHSLIRCASCKEQMRVREEYRNKRLQCPACGFVQRLTGPEVEQRKKAKSQPQIPPAEKIPRKRAQSKKPSRDQIDAALLRESPVFHKARPFPLSPGLTVFLLLLAQIAIALGIMALIRQANGPVDFRVTLIPTSKVHEAVHDAAGEVKPRDDLAEIQRPFLIFILVAGSLFLMGNGAKGIVLKKFQDVDYADGEVVGDHAFVKGIGSCIFGVILAGWSFYFWLC